MNIALLGYGKMGREIEKIALSRNHEIVLKIDISNLNDLTAGNLEKADVAIDFSSPESAFGNIMLCFQTEVPVVCGTTGWLTHFEEVKKKCVDENHTFFYASNYSIGVNLFFRLNKYLAKMMNRFPEYEPYIREIHHIHKLDAPSGTAITLAEGLIHELDEKSAWSLEKENKKEIIPIESVREGEVPGIHEIKFQSEVDFIEIKHSAFNRRGFALGAVMAAEFIHDKTGYYTMDQLMNAE